MEKALPAIPAKRYFTIGEVSELCGVKPYVLRYWEQEFTQLKPMKRRGNRRYYQHHEVLLVRRIRDLLYDQGFTINGARNRLSDALALSRAVAVAVAGDGGEPDNDDDVLDGAADGAGVVLSGVDAEIAVDGRQPQPRRSNGAAAETSAMLTIAAMPATTAVAPLDPRHLRAELLSIRELLTA